jgi:hypothetical protein
MEVSGQYHKPAPKFQQKEQHPVPTRNYMRTVLIKQRVRRLFLGLLNNKTNCLEWMERQSGNIKFKRLCSIGRGPIFGTTWVCVWIGSEKLLQISIWAHDLWRNAETMNDNLVAGEGNQERIWIWLYIIYKLWICLVGPKRTTKIPLQGPMPTWI